MDSLTKTLEDIDVTWKIAIKNALIVMGCATSSSLIGVIVWSILWFIAKILDAHYMGTEHVIWVNNSWIIIIFYFFLFGLLVGIFKVKINLSKQKDK